MDDGHNVIIVGLPDSGKTNFIMRLWLALRDNAGAVHSDGVPDDIEYLETGAADLLGGKFAPHTPHEVSNVSRIPISYNRLEGNATKGLLIVPDYSGEIWETVYHKRVWSEEWEKLFRQNCGCLLFVRADSEHLVPALDWISACKYFGSPEEVAAVVTQQHGESVTPSQVIFVEWLQFFRRAFTDNVGGDFRPKVGIVISAWDLVPEDQKQLGPAAYIESNFPLLKQFLDANSSDFDVQCFGVSIVGGDLDDAEGFRTEYLTSGPKSAGSVVYKENDTLIETKDLTFPVAWGLGAITEHHES